METGDAGLFSLINSKLGVKPKGHHPQEQQGLAHTHHQAAAQGQAKASRFADASQKVPAAKPQDRKELMAQRVCSSSVCWVVCMFVTLHVWVPNSLCSVEENSTTAMTLLDVEVKAASLCMQQFLSCTCSTTRCSPLHPAMHDAYMKSAEKRA